MKGIVRSIQKSKYGNFISGTIYACLAMPFMIWGFNTIFTKEGKLFDVAISFFGVIICLLFGLRSMFWKEKAVKTA